MGESAGVQVSDRHFGRGSNDLSAGWAENQTMPRTGLRADVPHGRRKKRLAKADRSPVVRGVPTRAAPAFDEGVAVGRHATEHDRRVRESIDEVDLGELTA